MGCPEFTSQFVILCRGPFGGERRSFPPIMAHHRTGRALSQFLMQIAPSRTADLARSVRHAQRLRGRFSAPESLLEGCRAPTPAHYKSTCHAAVYFNHRYRQRSPIANFRVSAKFPRKSATFARSIPPDPA